MSSPASPSCCPARVRWLAAFGVAIVCGVGAIMLYNRDLPPGESPNVQVPIPVDPPKQTDPEPAKPAIASDEWASATVARAIADGAGRKELATVWDELVAAAGPNAPADRFLIARRTLFDAAIESTRSEAFGHFEAKNYDRAFGVVRTQAVEWFKKQLTLNQEAARVQSELREAYRYLNALANAAGPAPEPAPEPRTREPAPEPRPRPIPDGCEAGHADDCTAEDGEDERINRVVKLIAEKKYATAATELAALAENREFPPALANAFTMLRVDVLRLDQVNMLKPNGDFPLSTAADNMPVAVKKEIARVETLQKIEALMTAAKPVGLKEMNEQLESVATAFGADLAGKLRVELSVKMFLQGETVLAIELLEGDIAETHARQLLADLHTLTIGGGSVENAQLAKLIPMDAPPAALKPILPTTALAKWQPPKLPANAATTLTTLNQQARRDVALAAKEEVEKLDERIAATIKSIRLQRE